MKLSLYSAVFAAALLCAGGYAQTTNLEAHIPFSFQVGETAMPAGNYSIQNSQNVLKLFDRDGHKSVFHLTMNASRSTVSRDPTLEFTRLGDEYFLTSVWNAGSSDGLTLTQCKREKELRRFKSYQVATVAIKPAVR